MKGIIYTDIVVLGGGAAGVAAAVAAARTGLKVTLIERNPFLGGTATAAEVGTLCGLYKFSKKESSEYIVGRFARTFAESLKRKSGTEPLHNNQGLHYLPYRIEAFKEECFDLLNESRVQIILQAEFQSLKISGNTIESVSVLSGGESTQFRLRSIIDCSGNSRLSQLADLPMIESQQVQAAAQVFTLQNISEENEAKLGIILMKSLQSAIAEKKLAHYFDRVYVVPGSLGNNCVSLKIGIPLTVTNTLENLLELKTTAHAFINELTDYLIKNVQPFKKSNLLRIAPQVGTRVGLRTKGKYVLTEDDVLQCRKFDDSIANGSWPIEEWEQDRRVRMRYFNEEDFYQIPAGCLRSAAKDNLFTAGRCISATDGAIASARVMGICLQTGYAAGYLAAANTLNPAAEDTVKNLQGQEF
jgi:hypothetical protein